MDWTQVICSTVTVLGTLGVAYITYGMKRDAKQSNTDVETEVKRLAAKVDNQSSELGKIRNELAQNNVQTARVDLYQAINHTPHEHKAILDLAWHYFIELSGDSWMSGEFTKWAGREQVDISHISAQVAHLRNKT